jgi:hypothetical protein
MAMQREGKLLKAIRSAIDEKYAMESLVRIARPSVGRPSLCVLWMPA